MNPIFDKQTCHDLAVAFAKTYCKSNFTNSDDTFKKSNPFEKELIDFEGKYIIAYQFFSREREE